MRKKTWEFQVTVETNEIEDFIESLANSLLQFRLPTKHRNRIMFICLARGYEPEDAAEVLEYYLVDDLKAKVYGIKCLGVLLYEQEYYSY
jgi:hypothetical protein